MILENFINSNVVETLGWTLVHSVWQIAFVSLILFLLRRGLRGFSANVRYCAACLALVFAVVLPFATFFNLWANSAADFAPRDVASFVANGEQADQNNKPLNNFSALKNAKTAPATTSGGEIFSISRILIFLKRNLPAVLPFAVGFWLFGAAFFALRLAGGFWQIRQFRVEGISVPKDEWQTKFFALYERLRIRQTVEFLQSSLIETPMVVGFFKPLILVPASAFLQIKPEELETIIAHELIHIRRYDCLVNLAQNVVEVLFFYHPCAWWISVAIRAEREFAADAAVIEFFGASPIIYANALANLEEARLAARLTAPPVLVAANGGNLMQRIQKILQKNTEISRANSLWSAGLALVLISAVMLSVFSFNKASFVNAQTKAATKKIAVGFVSIPPVDRMENPPQDAEATMRLLIEKLKANRVPAIGFVQGSMISDGENLFPVRAEIVRLWRDAGFEIGIGGFKHIWFYNTPINEYIANAEKNEAVTKKILAEKNLSLRYFSYPFLNTGKTLKEKDEFESWLNNRGLQSVKYTFDNSEWMYSFAYDIARKDNDVNTMNEVRAAYLEYMEKMTAHYEAYSAEMFGRDINQTLVLTSSRLVADTADEFFGMLAKRDYQFVSMDEAQADEAYQTKEAQIETQSGISWFERWQTAKGKRLLDEPKVSQYVQKVWDDKKLKN